MAQKRLKKRWQRGHFMGQPCDPCLAWSRQEHVSVLCHYGEGLLDLFEGILRKCCTLEWHCKAWKLLDAEKLQTLFAEATSSSITLMEAHLWAPPQWLTTKIFCAWKMLSGQPIIFKKMKVALKRSCLLCKRELEQIFKEVFFVRQGKNSCQHFRNKRPWPLEPWWVNPAVQ